MSLKRSRETGVKVRGEDEGKEPQAKKTNTERTDEKLPGSGTQVQTVINSMRSSIGIMPELSQIIGEYAELYPMRFKQVTGTPCWLNPCLFSGLFSGFSPPNKRAQGSCEQEEKARWHYLGWKSGAMHENHTCVILEDREVASLKLERSLIDSVRRFELALECQAVPSRHYDERPYVSTFLVEVFHDSIGGLDICITARDYLGTDFWCYSRGPGIAVCPGNCDVFAVTPINNRAVLDVQVSSGGIGFTMKGTSVSAHIPVDVETETALIQINYQTMWRMLVSFDPSISFENVYTL
jgi:hypothetical protein